MPSDTARTWLRANGYPEIADQIDRLMEDWKQRGLKTRKNWWDVLAGHPDGASCIVHGVAFPVLAAARERKGWPPGVRREDKNSVSAKAGDSVHNTRGTIR